MTTARQVKRWEATERQNAFLSRREYEVLYGGAKFGLKLLTLDTVLPTPTGWTTMGQVEVGDYLFDDRGLPCRVTHKSGVVMQPQLYKVSFADGSVIKADAGHKWLTFSEREIGQLRRRTDRFRAMRRDKRQSRSLGRRPDLRIWNHLHPPPSLSSPMGTVRTTAAMAQEVRGRLGWNYRVPVCKPLVLPDAILPLDPYTLGVWLGDGNTRGGRVTSADEEVLMEMALAGFPSHRLTSSGPYEYRVEGLTSRLRQLGVLKNKHIPSNYLRASESQRRALLMGLMDTDGSCAIDGHCTFTNTNWELITNIQELLASLGIRATIHDQPSTGKQAWTLSFVTVFPVFRLPRKAHRQPLFPSLAMAFNAIIAIEPLPTQPGQCLAVDSPSHLYLAGETMIPTHNTDALLMWSILRRQKYPRSRGLFIRREITELTKQGAAWDRCQEILGSSVRYNQTDHKVFFPNGSVLEFGHCHDESDRLHYQGAQYDDESFDQVEQFTWDMYSYIQGACRVPADNPPIAEGGQVIEARIRCSANPGDIGHQWVKEYFIDIASPETPRVYMVTVQRPDGGVIEIERSRVFIPASVFDSVDAGIIGPEYIATLEAMPEPYRTAYLYGRWDIFVGQAFPEFDRQKHVIPYDEALIARWRRIASHDWGFNAPGHHLWFAIDPEGGVIIYREFAFRHLDPQEIAQSILFHQGQEKVTTVWADPSIWQERRHADLTSEQITALSQAGKLQLSKVEQYQQAGLYCQPANNSRIAGKGMIHTLLKDRGDGIPYLRIMDTCPILIRTLQGIQIDPGRPEDVLTEYPPDGSLRDDAYDALRYGLMGLPSSLTPPKAEASSSTQWTWGSGQGRNGRRGYASFRG